MKASKLIKKQQPKRKIYEIDNPAQFAEANITFMENMLNIYGNNTILTEQSTETINRFIKWCDEQRIKAYGPNWHSSNETANGSESKESTEESVS